MPGIKSVEDASPSNTERVNSITSKGTPLNITQSTENVLASSTIQMHAPGTAPSLTVYARTISLQTADIRELLATANEGAVKNRNDINKLVKELEAQQEKSNSACEKWGNVVEDGKYQSMFNEIVYSLISHNLSARHNTRMFLLLHSIFDPLLVFMGRQNSNQVQPLFSLWFANKVISAPPPPVTSATTSLTESSKTLGAAIDTLYAKITSISHLGDVPALLSKQDNLLSKVLAKQEEQDTKLSTICAALEKIEPGVTNCLTQLTQQQQDGWRFGRDCGDGIDSAQRNNLSDSWLDRRWETQESRDDIASQPRGGGHVDYHGNLPKYSNEREQQHYYGRYDVGVSQKSEKSSLLDSQDHRFAIPAIREPPFNNLQRAFTPCLGNARSVTEYSAVPLAPHHGHVYSFTPRRPTQGDIEPLTPIQPFPIRQTAFDIQNLGVRQDGPPNMLPSKVGQLHRQGARAKSGNTASYVRVSTGSADLHDIIDGEETVSETESTTAGLRESSANPNVTTKNKRRRLLESEDATRGTDASFRNIPETEGEFLTPQVQGFWVGDFSRNNDVDASLLAATSQNEILQSQQLQFESPVDDTQGFNAKVQRTLERIDRNEALKAKAPLQTSEQQQQQQQQHHGSNFEELTTVRSPGEPSASLLISKKHPLPVGLQSKDSSTHPNATNRAVNSGTYVSKIMRQGEPTPASTRNASANNTIKAKPPASTSTKTNNTKSVIKPKKTTPSTTSSNLQSKHAKGNTKKKAINFVDVPKRPRVKVSAPIAALDPAAAAATAATAASAVASVTCPAPQAKPTLKSGQPAAASFAGSQAFETCIGGRMGSEKGNITTLAMHVGGGGVSLAGNESAAEGINRTIEHGLSGSKGNIASTSNEQYSDDLLNNFSSRRVLRKRKAVQYVY